MTKEWTGPRGRTSVLHVTQPVDGGTAAVVGRLAEADLEAGRPVTIACPPGALQRWATTHGIRWIDLPLTRRPAVGDVGAVTALRRLLPTVDVTYLHSSKAGAVGRLALATLPGTRRPRCVFVPHAWSWYLEGSASPVYRRFEQMASRWADVIVAVSPTEERDGRRVLPGSAAHKLVLIENGVDTASFSPAGPAAERTSDPLVVCVGRLCEQKGQDALLRALALVEDRTVRLDLVGDGPARRELEDLATGLGLGDRVTFLGATDPRPHYRAADVVVLPSRWEGQSLVLLEAMASGAAVVASPAASSGFGADQGVVTTEGSGPGHLAAALDLLLATPDLRARLGHLARATVVERHSSRRMATEHGRLIARLSDRTPPVGPALPSTIAP